MQPISCSDFLNFDLCRVTDATRFKPSEHIFSEPEYTLSFQFHGLKIVLSFSAERFIADVISFRSNVIQIMNREKINISFFGATVQACLHENKILKFVLH